MEYENLNQFIFYEESTGVQKMIVFALILCFLFELYYEKC